MSWPASNSLQGNNNLESWKCFLKCFLDIHICVFRHTHTHLCILMHRLHTLNPTDTSTLVHPEHWWDVEIILCPAPGDDYRRAAWLHESWSAGSAALIPDTRSNVNPSKGIFSLQLFCFLSKEWFFSSHADGESEITVSAEQMILLTLSDV